MVWHDEHRRNGTRTRQPRQLTPPPAQPGTSLPGALRTLHQRAGCPTPHSLAVATGNLLSADDVRKILHGDLHGTWEQVIALIRAMDGEPFQIAGATSSRS
ncbi:hypothetical protein AB0E25_41425 [Streptomyces bobili]|uniref:hypothetical protein n=1 Tax=Streptomyces bobili TaxID=67280 RepID=UPI0033EB73A0